MVHSTPDNEGGCEFSLFFSTTPGDLIQDGLYREMAVALYPSPFFRVSACLVARALGAMPLKRGVRKLIHALSRPDDAQQVLQVDATLLT